MIDKPWMGMKPKMVDDLDPMRGDPQMTENVDDILERVAEVSMKGLYRDLRQVGVALETDSLRETLTMMCDAQLLKHFDESDREELPQVGDFHDFGKQIQYGRKTKRKPHRTPDSVANQQQTIQWTDNDREVADYEAKDWEGEHRGNADEGYAIHGEDIHLHLNNNEEDNDD